MAAEIRPHDPVYLSTDYDDTDKLTLMERRLEEKAIRERWPIDPAKRLRILERLIGVVENPEECAFNAIAAAKALISADRLNLEERKLDLSQAMPDPHDGDFVMDMTPADADANHPAQ